jgi:molecular chaperone Hsp33
LRDGQPDGRASGRADRDLIQPFLIEGSGLRGRLVRLGPAVETILGAHAYPAPAARLLGEALALAAALAGALKYDGVFTLQAKGDGAVRLLVADVTSAGDLRGYAQADAARLTGLDEAALPRLMGAGHLAFTVDQGPETDRYQGIVALDGATLADCIHHYFRQSDQYTAALKVAAARVADGSGAARWRAGAITLQRLPPSGRSTPDEDEAAEDGWRRALALMGSVRSDELLDPTLAPDQLLWRLFHEEGVRVFAPQGLRARCRCSAHRVEAMLRALGPAELEEYLVDGHVVVTCQFCNETRRFDQAALTRLGQPASPEPSEGHSCQSPAAPS